MFCRSLCEVSEKLRSENGANESEYYIIQSLFSKKAFFLVYRAVTIVGLNVINKYGADFR